MATSERNQLHPKAKQEQAAQSDESPMGRGSRRTGMSIPAQEHEGYTLLSHVCSLCSTTCTCSFHAHAWEDSLQQRHAPAQRDVHYSGRRLWSGGRRCRDINRHKSKWVCSIGPHWQHRGFINTQHQLGHWYFSAMVRVIDFNSHKPQSTRDQWIRKTGLSYQAGGACCSRTKAKEKRANISVCWLYRMNCALLQSAVNYWLFEISHWNLEWSSHALLCLLLYFSTWFSFSTPGTFSEPRAAGQPKF